MKKLNFLVSYPYNRITEKLIGYLVETGHQVDMLDSPDTPRWLDKYYYNLTIIPPNKISSKQYDFQLDTEKPQSIDLPLLHIDAKKLVNNGIQCAVKLHLQKNVFTIFSKKIIYQKDFSEIYSEIKELFIDAIVYLAREAEKLKLVSLDPCDCDSFLEIFQMEEGISKLNAFYEAIEKSDSEKFILRNLLINSSFSQSKKSLTLNKITLSVTEVEFITLFLTTLLNARHQSSVHYNIAYNKKTITKYIDICPSMTFDTILKNLHNPIYDVKNSRFFNHYVDSRNPAEILLQIEENEENNIILQNDYLLIIRYNTLSGELTLIYQEQLYFFDEAQQYIHYFLKNFESWKEKKEALQTILYTETHLYHQQLYEWNSNFSEEIEDRTVHELFEEQANRTPDNIAVVYKNVKLSYADLNKKANQLAHYLKENHAIKPDDIIALYLGRSEYIIIAILGVLKAGGAYVPIETNWPEKRVDYILEDTKATIVLTEEKKQEKLKKILKEKIALKTVSINNDLFIEKLLGYSEKNADFSSNGENLAYIIYTSGTTGNPKGVLIEHNGVVNLAIAQEKAFEKYNKKEDKYRNYLLYGSYIFDASISEIFTAILNGHTLHIAETSIRSDLNLLKSYIAKNNVQVATIPPSLLTSETLLNLETLIVAGEKTPIDILKSYGSKTHLINGYGPTEATVCSSLNHFKENDSNLNIGKSIFNKLIYILDDSLTPVPIGVIGEIYIGGVGIARNYLNLKEKSNNYFIPNPFKIEKNKFHKKSNRLYKTGDLARLLPNGEIILCGRNDSQIKMRGYRIELEEIENLICSYREVNHSVVILSKNKINQYLTAYYTSKNKINENELISYLSEFLPAYMIPSQFLHLKQFPLTENGKINKSVLNKYFFDDEFIPSFNESEKYICKAFSESLGVKNVKITDDFFMLGGNSINVMRLTLKLQKHFSITINDIFKLRNPKLLAEKFPPLNSNLFKDKLNKVKEIYKTKAVQQKNILFFNEKIETYLQDINKKSFNPNQLKPISNLLLTGSTGFLGSGILYFLLVNTQYNIHLLIREKKNKSPYTRIAEKIHHYFNIDLKKYKNRVFIYTGDLEKYNLGISTYEYQALASCIDSTIHSAALVKHYGEEENFYLSNVQATINLLELTNLTKNKDFHYISTAAPLFEGKYDQYDYFVFDERDDPNLIVKPNLYAKTKYMGENIVIKYRSYGICSNIYRIGNLAFIEKTNKLQKNIEDNAFYHWLKGLIQMKLIAKEISTVDITPADWAADAIVRLFNKADLSNQVFHVFNPYQFDLSLATLDNRQLFKIFPIDDFVKKIIEFIDQGQYTIIERFLLHQGWLNEKPISRNRISVLQKKTQYALSQCGFKWKAISNQLFQKYVENGQLDL